MPPYFLVAFEGGMSNPKLFRVYSDDDALLFIYSGPFHPNMRDAISQMRGESSDHSTAVAQAMGRTAAIGARTGGLAGAGLGVAAGGVVGGLMAVGNKVAGGQVAKRTQVLDAMTIDELRQEAKTGQYCFRVAPDNVAQVQLRPPSTGLMSMEDQTLAGYLQFVHQPTGKWKLQLMTEADARDAVREFRRVLGVDKVNVQFPF